MSNPSSVLILNVGGFQYTVKRNMLLQFPDSFFDKMLKSEWKESSANMIDIQRDGELFKHVYDYMFYGKLPRNEVGMSLLSDESTLKGVMQEADFYNLPGLVAECEESLNMCEAEQRVKVYITVLDDIHQATSAAYHPKHNVIYQPTGPDSLIALLRSNPLFAQAWLSGTLTESCNPEIFMSTTVQNVNVPELIAAGLPSPFGRGSETVMDKNVRDSLEIPANKLCDLTKIVDSIDISSLALNMKLTLKPYKLVIYQEGGHFDSHRDTVRDEHHIGTLVLILNSEYTGGELEVSHGEQNLVVAGALNWVAMFGDCLHTIRPVTSGTRVSLIFDIWNDSDKVSSKTKMDDADVDMEGDEDDDEDEYDEDYYKEVFWPDNEIIEKNWRSKGTTKKALENTSIVTPAVGIDKVWNRIYAALDKELEEHETVSICLEHLYPACQANPDFLKGNDANLYQMLKGKYSLGVTAITIARVHLLGEKDDFGYSEFGSKELIDGGQKGKNAPLFVPNALDPNSVFHYMYGAEYTGNAAQEIEQAYLVAALVVRKL